MTPIERDATRLSYGLTQGARVFWYTTQGLLMRRMIRQMAKDLPEPKRPFTPPENPTPSLSVLLQGVLRLLKQDLANVEKGFYPLPRDEQGGLFDLLSRSKTFFKDAREVERRRRENRHQDVFKDYGKTSDLPRYYLQNFHFQTDGWLSEQSAELYETQVNVLFHGATAAMRRMGVAEIIRAVKGKDQRQLHTVDIATGTGAFLKDLTRALPRLKITGIDLSEEYLNKARTSFKNRPHIQFKKADAETMPFEDESIDIAASTYLFHELPPKVRLVVAKEIARILKPGGLFVLTDSLQWNDTPAYNGLLESFPELFHEPYYKSYLHEDFEAIFGKVGLNKTREKAHFFSKVMTFTKV